jgi:hypothetical protein
MDCADDELQQMKLGDPGLPRARDTQEGPGEKQHNRSRIKKQSTEAESRSNTTEAEPRSNQQNAGPLQSRMNTMVYG